MLHEQANIKLRKYLPQPEALKLIPEEMARKYKVIPLEVHGNVLRVAMADAANIFAWEALETHTQKLIELETASAEEIQEAIDFNYRSYDEIEKQISNISSPGDAAGQQIELDTASNTPVARAISLIIDEAVKAGASDIHLQPEEDELRVRYRVDGTLHDTLSMPLTTATTLISRIKILANMNIADHHRPQDGQFSIKTQGDRSIDIRVGIMPQVHGEMATLRLLDKTRASMGLSDLGFLPESLAMYEKMLKVPHGMILISGPTGAGKSTTLYASVNSLDLKERNVITIEDPVEYRFRRINQVQVNPRAGLTFATGLRSILRLDPDVILVGEVRDAETAKIAIQAALTGHLVLSSIHANDAVGIIFRLLDLGIESFLVSTALIGVVAQRMVRRVCPDCVQPRSIPLVEEMIYSRETSGINYPLIEERRQFPYGNGCKSCGNTGYQGRVGIFEIMHMSDEIRAMLLTGTTPARLRAQAIRDGMVPLIRDGMLKVKAGITTPSEVLRNTYSVD
ncbi:MAG: GspE/PulE family protein [Dehalococcoidales bacterium]|nr:GspE/PulE family protein [Dehalococcoidales bacterium]